MDQTIIILVSIIDSVIISMLFVIYELSKDMKQKTLIIIIFIMQLIITYILLN